MLEVNTKFSESWSFPNELLKLCIDIISQIEAETINDYVGI